MLTLGVKDGEYIVIGDNIVVQMTKIDNGIRLNIDAPKDVSIRRAAIYEKDNPTPACIIRESKG